MLWKCMMVPAGLEPLASWSEVNALIDGVVTLASLFLKNSKSTSLMSINVRVAPFKVSKTLTFYSIIHQDPRVPIGNMLKSHYDEYQMGSNPQTLGSTSVIKPVELQNYFPEAIDLRLHFTHGSLKQRCRSRHAVQYGQLILTMCQSGEAVDTYCVVFGLIRPWI